MTVEIGSKYTPAHAVHRDEREFWERNPPPAQWSRDELKLQQALLKKEQK